MLSPKSTGLMDRAVALHRQGDTEQALGLYRQILADDPLDASVRSNVAIILKTKGDIQQAAEMLQKAIVVRPNLPAAYNNFGNFLRENQYRNRAPTYNSRCVLISPFYAEGYNNLGMSIADTEPEKRAQTYKKALVLKPDYPEGWLNCANNQALLKKDKVLPICYYDRCLMMKPNYPAANSSSGVYLASIGELSGAIERQEKAIRLDPDYEESYFNLALYYLLSGRFHEGFSLYEHGIGGRSADLKRGKKRRVVQPRWNGESLAKKTILVTAEQGVGDEIMFSSLISELSRRAAKVFLESTPRLVPLMRRSYPEVEVFEYNPKSPSRYLSSKEIDFSVPLGSLALYFRKSLFSFGRQRPFLVPNLNLARHFRHKYKSMFPGKRLVGFSWRGGSGQLRSQSRSLDLETFASLLDFENVQAISLQYGVTDEEAEWIKRQGNGRIYHDEMVDPLESMDIAAAQIAAVDLVVSVTNAAVHSAGALGMPCWILVPHISDWRWTWGRTDVPWYPGMRTFRQDAVGDWTAPLMQVKEELSRVLKGAGSIRAAPAPDMDWRGDL